MELGAALVRVGGAGGVGGPVDVWCCVWGDGRHGWNCIMKLAKGVCRCNRQGVAWCNQLSNWRIVPTAARNKKPLPFDFDSYGILYVGSRRN